MGFIQNRIMTPLVDAFGNAVANSSIGKQIYKNVDDRIIALEKLLRGGISDTSDALKYEIGKAADQIAHDTQVGTISSGMLSGLGGLVGGGIAGTASGVLGPIINSQINPGINISGLPPEMQEKLRIIVKRNL